MHAHLLREARVRLGRGVALAAVQRLACRRVDVHVAAAGPDVEGPDQLVACAKRQLIPLA